MSWKQAIEDTKGSIMAIMVDQVRAFEDDWQHSGQATGFVVDAERGIVLTNRHVVTAGPIVARGIFDDLREVALYPLYRDPIHDFGFLQYNPTELRGRSPRSLILSPESAQEGVEIRVIGNDAGEGFSILSGTLSRLDRDAPDYGEGNYSDYNTFYLQAASMTSGGSSGSPVIDELGQVVGLNAGGHREAATAYFLPVSRVLRALEELKLNKKVVRGTIHTMCVHHSYDELLRRSIPFEVIQEATLNFPKSKGLLVVHRVLPKTEASKKLRVGDCLFKVNGKIIDSFEPFEVALDDSVGGTVQLTIIRSKSSGKVGFFEVDIPVEDLDASIPAVFLEIGEAILHQISSVHAWHLNCSPQGVILSSPGYLFNDEFLKKGSLIESVAGKKVSSLDSMLEIFKELSQGETFSVRFRHYRQPTSVRNATFVFSTSWFPCRKWARVGSPERWESELIETKKERINTVLSEKKDEDSVKVDINPPRNNLGGSGDGEHFIADISSALVHIHFRSPYVVAGWHRYDSPRGTGLIVDKDAGLVVTDRSTIWHSVGDVTVTLAGSVERPARVVYVHPLHNLALIQLSKGDLLNLQLSEVKLSSSSPSIGTEVQLVGINEYGTVQQKKCSITAFRSSSIRPPSGAFFQETNIDLIHLNARHVDFNGAMVGKDGNVLGLWAIFAYTKDSDFEFLHLGISAQYVGDLLRLWKEKRSHRWIEADLGPVRLPELRRLNVPTSWIERIERVIGDGPKQLLRVISTSKNGVSDGKLEAGDIVLAINEEIVTDHRSLEVLVQNAEVSLTLWREGREVVVELEPQEESGDSISHIIHWSGLVIHSPHPEVRRVAAVNPIGVHVASGNYGSPSYRAGIEVGSQIVAINGVETPNLEQFINVVKSLSPKSSIVVTVIESTEIERVVSLIPETQLWPTYELRRGDEGDWVRVDWD